MKKFILTTLSFLAFTSLNAQRSVDLKLEILNPVNGFSVETNTAFTLQFKVTNVGAETFLAEDTLALYLIVDGDTSLQTVGNYRVVPSNELEAGESQIFTEQAAFGGVNNLTNYIYCLYVKPRNAANPVSDPVNVNNMECIQITVTPQQVNGIGENTKEDFFIYPNPVQNELSISGNDLLNVKIIDQTGKKVLEHSSDFNKIDCSDLNNGIYFAVISSASSTSYKKFIVKK